MATAVKIPYKPRLWARELHQAVTRWIVLVIHRRGGKTTAAFNHLQRDAINKPNTRYAYIAPTYKQAKRIVWGMAKFYSRALHDRLVADGQDGIKYNESELLITYPNGSQIMILGSEDPDSLRGIALWGCFLDEYPLHSPIVFTEVVSKCLADNLGYCIFGGTPRGKGHFHKVFVVAKNNPDEYTLVYRSIDQSLEAETGATIENLKQALEDDRKLVKQGLMTEDEYQQEWYNSFEAAIKGAVYLKQLAEARAKDRITNVPHNPSLPVFTVWDLGVSKSDAMAIGFFQRVNKETRIIDYYETTGQGLTHCIKVVKDKPYVYGKHFAPHDITHKELSTGKTRQEAARKLGIDFEVVPSVPLEDGIDMARGMFSRLWIDKTACEFLVDLLGQYHYEFDEKRGILTRRPVHDFTSHAADMVRYAAIVEDDMTIEEYPEVPETPDLDVGDEYVGQEDTDAESKPNFGKHPMLRNVDIGKLGHRKQDE